MRKILAVILAFSLSISGACVYADAAGQRSFDDFSDGIGTWQQYADENSSVSGKDAENNKALVLKSSSPKGKSGNVRAASPEFSSDGKVALDVTFSTDFDNVKGFSPDRTLYLVWGGEQAGKTMNKIAPVFCVEGADLLIGNDYSESGVSIENNRIYNIKVLVDTNNFTANILVDGNEVGTTNLWKADSFESQNLKFMFEINYPKNKNGDVSTEWDIYKYAMSNVDELSLETDIDNPELVSTDIGEINVFMGTVVKTADVKLQVLNDDSYEDVDINFDIANSRAKITPKSELEPAKKYRILVENAESMFGTTGLSASTEFTTEQPGYEKPTVSITSVTGSDSFRVGNSIPLAASVTNTSPISKVEFFVNGSLYRTVKAAPYECKYRINAEGEYTVYAKVYDEIGGIGQSEKITVKASENQKPSDSILKIGGMAEVEKINKIEVEATDDSGVASVTMYVDGKAIGTKTEAPYTFDWTPSLGKHTFKAVAVDIDDSVAETETEVTVVKNTRANKVDEDFEGCTVGDLDDVKSISKNYPGTMYSGLNKGGYLRAAKIDDEHGTSMLVGSDNDAVFEKYTNQLIGVEDYSKSGILDIQNDIYFSADNAKVQYKIRANPTSPDNIIFEGKNGKIEIKMYNGASVGKTVEISAKEWHTLRYVINLGTQSYDFYVDDMETPAAVNFSFRSKVEEIYFNIRYEFECDGRLGTYMAVDNYKYDYCLQMPYVMDVTGTDGGSVQGGQNKFFVKTNAEVGNISAERVSLTRNGETVPIDYVVKQSGGFLVVTKSPIQSGGKYVLTMDKDITDSEGNALGYDNYAEFTVAAGGLNMSDGKFQKTANSISFTANLTNGAGTAENVTLALVIYKDGRIVKTEYLTKAVKGDTEFSISDIDIPSGNITAKAFVFGGWSRLTPIINNVYTLN